MDKKVRKEKTKTFTQVEFFNEMMSELGFQRDRSGEAMNSLIKCSKTRPVEDAELKLVNVISEHGTKNYCHGFRLGFELAVRLWVKTLGNDKREAEMEFLAMTGMSPEDYIQAQTAPHIGFVSDRANSDS